MCLGRSSPRTRKPRRTIIADRRFNALPNAADFLRAKPWRFSKTDDGIRWTFTLPATVSLNSSPNIKPMCPSCITEVREFANDLLECPDEAVEEVLDQIVAWWALRKLDAVQVDDEGEELSLN